MEQTPATTANASEAALAKAKSTAEKKFELQITECNNLVTRCKAIKITDSTTLALANQTLSEAAVALKEVEKRRKDLIKPSQDYIDFVNGLVKSKMTIPLTDVVALGKVALKTWNDLEVIRVNQEKADNQKFHTFLETCKANAQKQIDGADTIEKCDAVIKALETQWPADARFGGYVKEATDAKNTFIATTKMQKTKIKAAVSGQVTEFMDAEEVIAETVTEQNIITESAATKKEQIEESLHATTSAVRNILKWEVVDESKLPREFLSVDADKVKAYMKLHADAFKEAGSTTKAGVRFFVDAVPLIK